MKPSLPFTVLLSVLLPTGVQSQLNRGVHASGVHAAAAADAPWIINPNPSTYSTYSCAEQEVTCGLDTDRYYELIAGYNKYWIDGFPSVDAVLKEEFEDRSGAYWRIRTMNGGIGFDDDQRNENITLAPTMRVKPGETMAILMRNEVPADAPPVENQLESTTLQPEKWLPMLNASNPTGRNYGLQAGGFQFTGPTPISADQVNVPNKENIPHFYNHLNLHLHGMVVQPHLFFPQGTIDAKADWISAGTGECYCYQFYVPADHPTGTYWYHTHRHGSSAMWTWAQTAGLIDVQGTLQEELEAQGVTTKVPFVVTDQYMKPSEEEENTYVVQPFLDMQTDSLVAEGSQFIVNGANKPTFEMKPGETWWVQYLAAVVNIVNAFEIRKASDGSIVPVWDIASDGINYAKPVQKSKFVNGGGMRQDLLLQFDEPGIYEVWTSGLQGVQFFGLGPADQLMATFNVTGEPINTPVIDIADMTLTEPDHATPDIAPEEIVRTRIVTFDIGGDTTIFPFPQFKVNQKAFELDRIQYDLLLDGHAEEWILISTTNAVHPFHLHVLPFQVRSVFSGFNGTVNMETIQATEVIDPYPQWRDTVVIPPYGMVRIWIRFRPSPLVNLNGKSVFHCHMLAHEDTGMISAIRYIDPNFKKGQAYLQGLTIGNSL